MLYKVIEMEIQNTRTGKVLKKVTLKGEGQDHLEPRTTIWENHPDFDKATIGADIRGTLEKKDSGNPIPAHPEKNYVNRTLLAEGEDPRQAKGEVKTPEQSKAFVEDRLKRLEDKVFGTEDTINYPESTEEEIPF